MGIIVPAYNVEKYIDQSLRSLLSQKTDYTFKIIVVEDGSTDSTAEILKQYETIENIKVIHQENRGYSGAKNRAFEVIDFRYVFFVDSDDYIAENSLDILLKTAFTNDADIVEGGFIYFSAKDSTVRTFHRTEEVDPLKGLTGYVGGKLIKSEFFRNVIFPPGYLFEDSIFSSIFFFQCKKAFVIKEPVYYYRFNSEGVTEKSRTSPKALDALWITEQLIKDQKTLGITCRDKVYEQVLSEININYLRTRLLGDDVNKALFVLTCDLFEKEFPGFKTAVRRLMPLEKALRTKDYNAYLYYCSL